MGEADQLLSQGDPRRRGIQRRQTRFDLLGLKLYSPLRVSKGQSGIAQLARYPYVISRLRAASAQGFSLCHLANDGHADIERPLRGIAADKLDLIRPGKCEKS